MPGGKITREDLGIDVLLKDFESVTVKINEVSDSFAEFIERAKELGTVLNTNGKNQTEYNKTVDELNQTYQSATQKEKELLELEQERQKVVLNQIKIDKQLETQKKKELDLKDKEKTAYYQLTQKIKELRKERDQLAKIDEKSGKVIIENTRKYKDYNKEIDKTQKELNKLKDNEQKRVGGIGQYFGAIKKFATSVVLPVAAVVGIIKGIGTAFKEVFTSTDEGAIKWQGAMMTMKNSLTIVKQEMYNVLFAGGSLGDLFKNIGERAKRSKELSMEYAKMLDEINDRKLMNISSEAAELDKITELYTAASDLNKTDKERIVILKEHKRLTEEHYNKKKKLEEESFNQMVAYSKQFDKTNTLTDEAVAAFIKMDEAGQTTLMTRKSIPEDMQNVSEQELENIEKHNRQAKIYKDFFDSISVGENSLAEQLERQAAALDEIDRQRERALKRPTGTLSGLEKKEGDTREPDKEITDFLNNVTALAAKDAGIIESTSGNVMTTLADHTAQTKADQQSYYDWKKQREQAAWDRTLFYSDETAKLLVSGAQLAANIYDRQIQERERQNEEQAAKYERMKNIELQQTGKTESQKTAIKAKYDNLQLESERKTKTEIAKIQRKQEIMNRIAASFEIGVNTAIATTDIARTGGGTHYADMGISAGMLASLVIANGAMQEALLWTKPLPEIPAYKKGTKGAKGGMSLIGEEGREAIRDHGKVFITPDAPTIMNIPKGAEVIPNDILKQQLTNFDISKGTDFLYIMDDTRRTNKELLRHFKNQKQLHVNINEQGISLIATQGSERTKYLDNRYRR